MAELEMFLLELGVEELPTAALATLGPALMNGIRGGLETAGLAVGDARWFATPRRLAVQVDGLPRRQADRTLVRRGPAKAAAFAADGSPTGALQGFARSCGVSTDALTVQETDKGAWVVFEERVAGAQTVDLLPAIVEAAVDGLPIAKRMRWGLGDVGFVRPVHWVVALMGEAVVPMTLFGVQAGRDTRGHRFHHPGTLSLDHARDYPARLASDGKVIADLAERKTLIRNKVEATAKAVGGIALIDEDILDEVSALTEWPVAMTGSFDERFLQVPQRALITTMQDNQKYFPVVDAGGVLQPCFVFIANIESADPAQVVAGNQRVIRPRFADAEFFWTRDRQRALADRQDALRNVVFQQKLGSLHDKSDRVAQLAAHIADAAGVDRARADRAGRLAKCDLLTDMVQEFPELQGYMGRAYAQGDGESSDVASAIEEQYWPTHAGAPLPTTAVGRVLALADRLDTLVGIFAIGQAPSGNKDPFALRRAALGALRLMIEPAGATGELGVLDLDLLMLIRAAAGHFPEGVGAGAVVDTVFDFMLDRLRTYYLDQGVRPDEFDAVLACRPTRPVDFHGRLLAIKAFRHSDAGAALAAANKRTRNILRKSEADVPDVVELSVMTDPQEKALLGALTEARATAEPLLAAGDYRGALAALSALRAPVDSFFDSVMVMADDPLLRANRLALLGQLAGVFLRVADLSRLQD